MKADEGSGRQGSASIHPSWERWFTSDPSSDSHHVTGPPPPPYEESGPSAQWLPYTQPETYGSPDSSVIDTSDKDSDYEED